ncbi:hypothetical protein vBYenSP400_39 [Yersinia phage vB_YenS_P400]|nr:hypothetical protein vBYenSP400_39 [Yersinia phage vB_YenS_P400]
MMTQYDFEKAVKLGDAINHFKKCYEDCTLWGSAPDGDIIAEKMIEWLLENTHMMDIAKQIDELSR